jgi:SAM-dependent methyltransferase
VSTTDAGDASYVIRSGTVAFERLELIARLLWPTSEQLLARAGAFEGRRFLDVGCGIGDVAARVGSTGRDAVGIDVNADVVAGAAARSLRIGAPATFRVAGLSDLGVDKGCRDFDVVYARCVLSHQSDPAAGLASMLAAVRPGGTVLVEDVDVAAVWSSPPCDALARHVELYLDAARGLGAHPDVGCQLATLLRELGADDIDVRLVQPVLHAPEDLQVHARTMEAIAGPVVAQGLATEAEVAALVAELDEWSEAPGVFATLPRVVQVTARAPGR